MFTIGFTVGKCWCAGVTARVHLLQARLTSSSLLALLMLGAVSIRYWSEEADVGSKSGELGHRICLCAHLCHLGLKQAGGTG